MKKIYHYYFIFIIFYSYFIFPQSSRIEFVSIECPKEIIISKNMDTKNQTVKFRINYKYYGRKISADDGRGNIYSGYRDVSLTGQIYYVDKNNRILPGAFKHFKNYGLSGGIEGIEMFLGGGIVTAGESAIFENGKIYSKEFNILVPSFFKKDPFFPDMDIYKKIQDKSLSTVLLVIEKIKLTWELKLKNNSVKSKKSKGHMECDVNIVQIVQVKYD
jgi:hypothetical protein